MARFYDVISSRNKSIKEGKPLEHCSSCERKLDYSDYYLIAKAFHRGDCVLEVVQCLKCQMDSKQYASEQSMENLMLYSGRRFSEFITDPMKRDDYHSEEPACLITGEELVPHDSFELYSFYVPGSGLVEDENYLFVGPTAMEQMADLLSEETRKSWGRFVESLTPETPEIVISPLFMS